MVYLLILSKCEVMTYMVIILAYDVHYVMVHDVSKVD